MEFLKNAKKRMILTAIAFVVVGVVLCIWPTSAMNFICFVVGAGLVLGGAWSVIAYLRGRAEPGFGMNSFTGGVFEIIFGVILLCRPGVVQVAVPLILSVLLLVDSIVKLQIAIDLKRVGYSGWWQLLIASLVCGCAAVLFIIDPIASAASIVIIIGASFIVNGLADLWTTLYIARKAREYLGN